MYLVYEIILRQKRTTDNGVKLTKQELCANVIEQKLKGRRNNMWEFILNNKINKKEYYFIEIK